ncbi:DHA2 family efflux MFS transporter permease subunit [Acinetobacter guerrae]|uniref:DHA2 family efflux MFS transporter permease subunit n=1 Tax=Acinetobacter guerrae TaxID=1843371 RepID=UPI00125F2E28|nr:DHA2 family efflux MFS transporter permease subunit [Acinetobacter guerrae]
MNSNQINGSNIAQPLSKNQKMLIFGIMAFGMFLALLDTQIVAASLNDIQAGLLASPDEISWVQTAYLMAEIVMIPFSAFLAQAMSTRFLFSISAGLFTLSSFACGFAWNIESMTIFRAIQGFTGGAMIPTVFAVGFLLFDEKERVIIPAILGMVSVLAPTLGPTIGGIITSYIGWHWIFFINIIPGTLVTWFAYQKIQVDQANFKLFKKIDWIHLFAMIFALGCLQYVLEEGPQVDWFNDHTIAICAWISLVSFCLFLERSFFSANPIVKLTAFKNSSFLFACIFNFVIGFGLYSSTYLVPVYLVTIRGFSSLQIGLTVFVVGIAQFFSTIIAAKLSEKADARILFSIGLPLFAYSLWLMSNMNHEWGFSEFLVPQILRGLSIMLCIVPSVNVALSGFKNMELRYASGLFNLMRNLGGAIGIALVNTWLQDQSRISHLRLSENLGIRPQQFNATFLQLTQQLSQINSDSQQTLVQAMSILEKVVKQQALSLAFDQVFRLMAIMFFIATLLIPFAKAKGSTVPKDTH